MTKSNFQKKIPCAFPAIAHVFGFKILKSGLALTSNKALRIGATWDHYLNKVPCKAG